MRLGSKCEIELEQHTSVIVLGGDGGIPTADFGVPAVEVLDAVVEAAPADAELERLRILARSPRWGAEIDETILPAEAGLDERAISFSKGCYPGQEPIARLHHRGHANRTLRVIELDGEATPGDEVAHGGKPVGRVTSVVPGLALAYVRVEVPEGAELEVGGGSARLH
jgi:folate-binding protein YgfZ